VTENRSAIPLNQEPGFQGADAPAEVDMYRCVHCGLCLSACPTYTHLGVETESPRGRIAYMKAVHEGRLGISDRVVSHWEMCLQCRACEAVCPSGVPYGRIMEHTRAQVLAQDKQGDNLKRISRLFLRAALPHPKRLRWGAHLVRAYQHSGIQKLVRRSRVLKVLSGHADELEAQFPVMGRQFFGPSGLIYRAKGEKKVKVGLLSGCVMPLMQGSTMHAAVRVLNRNGCDVVVPVGQGCCGALNLHAGDLETGRKLARRNIDVFLEAGVDRIVTASAGCGSSMKEYHELLMNDPQYADKARQFSELTEDITEFLVSLPLDPPKARLDRRVTYQDPCHLAHAQRITQEPRAILKAISGLQLVEMEQAAMCCGSAGFYSLVQPDLAGKILDTKLKNVMATGAEQVITANPGCMMQIEMGLHKHGVPGKVLHVVDILDEAYQAEASLS
jgi:Fe-S oxidoreductase